MTGITALARQARFERRSEPDVVAKASLGITAIDGLGLLTVTAINTGRGAIQATGWGFHLPDGRSVMAAQAFQGSSPIPLTLEGGHQGRWSMPVEPISPIVGVNDAGDIQLFPFVNLGDGSTVEGDPLS